MPIISLKQLGRLLSVAANALLPVSRIAGVRSETRGVLFNVIGVVIIVLVVIGIALTSPFSGGDLAGYKDGAIVWKASMTRVVAGVWGRLLVATLCIAIVVVSFVVDLVDVVTGASDRLQLRDPENKTNAAWSLAIVLMGYACRLWLFGVVTTVGIQQADTVSIVATGQGILGVHQLAEFGGVADTATLALGNPLAAYGEHSSGSWLVNCFLIVVGLSRLIIGAMLLGTFHVLLPGLGLRHDAESQAVAANNATQAASS